MPSRRNGAFKLFRVGGIDVLLHWTWFLVAYWRISLASDYHSPVWKIVEYLSLFLIVLMHEFGHALACRQTGGKADEIILWPLGGVAFVSPPPRPGAYLWSIAAGPLVNVLLLPILFGFQYAVEHGAFGVVPPDMIHFARDIAFINLGLLCFNILPVYPLDGGQIVRALLWFMTGPIRSLYIASVIGMAGAAGFLILAAKFSSIWLVAIAVFLGMQCVNGFKSAQAQARLRDAPRHDGLACPACGAAPLAGNFWSCGKCRQTFDMFEANGLCPGCGAQFANTVCPSCRTQSPLTAWRKSGQPIATF